MKYHIKSLLPVFVFVFCSSYSGHSQNRQYFAHKIIIKYKTDSQLQSIRTKTNSSPKQQVRQVLQKVGLIRMRAVFRLQNHPALKTTGNSRLRKSAQNLSRIFEVSYTANADAQLLARKISTMPGVTYAEPKYLRRMQFTPNDPIVNPYQDYHRFEEAWDVTRGSSDVIIAIVDGGVNYLHPELDSKLWVNTAEVNPAVRAQIDQNADGHINSTEVMQFLNQTNGDYNNDGTITLRDALAQGSPLLSGTDTDGNGYIDDIFGWDFWQAGGVNGQPVTEDNDPLSDATDHGAHVAGIATAETNNGQGLAGTGFNSRYMAVKAGGIPDDPSTSDDESDIIGFGYDAIIYAAMEGADVINCSWGGGGFSAFENDVINFATEAGALVVAASGNEATTSVDFPSAYAKTFSVGSVETSGQIASYSNRGYNIDAFATGSHIQSTSFDSAFVTKSGTSMSTPVAAGLAALVKAVHPLWPPLRIAAQMRSSSTFLNENDARQGHGILNAYQGVTTNLPGIRILTADFKDSKGQKLGLGEDGSIRLKIINYGAATSTLNLQMESLVDQGISLKDASQNVGSLATGDSTTVSFGVSIAGDYDLTNIPTFRLNITDNSNNYSDFDVIQYPDILFDVVDANNIKTSFGADGTIGFTDAFASRGGVGFVTRPSPNSSFADGQNLLFEGGLMIETNDAIFDAVRGTGDNIEKDFEPEGTFVVNKKGATSAQDGRTTFIFRGQSGQVSGQVRLQTFAFTKPELANVIYLKYSVKNTSATLSLRDMYVGLFNDWDIGNTVDANSIGFSQPDSILYLSNPTEENQTPIVAVAQLGAISSVLAINNFAGTNPIVDLNDGFSDAEKKAALKAGRSKVEVSSGDVSAVTASGPYTLNPHSTLTVGFVYAFGDDVATLRKQVKAARAMAPFSVSPTGVTISNTIPEKTNLFQNYPNPFTGSTTIRFDLKEEAHVKLTLYDELGRKVQVLKNEQMDADEHRIPFQPGSLSSGVYYLRLQTDQKIQTIPLTYFK